MSELKPEIQNPGLSEALSSAPEVDMDLVASVRDELSRGEISLDPEALSKAIMEMYA